MYKKLPCAYIFRVGRPKFPKIALNANILADLIKILKNFQILTFLRALAQMPKNM